MKKIKKSVVRDMKKLAKATPIPAKVRARMKVDRRRAEAAQKAESVVRGFAKVEVRKEFCPGCGKLERLCMCDQDTARYGEVKQPKTEVLKEDLSAEVRERLTGFRRELEKEINERYQHRKWVELQKLAQERGKKKLQVLDMAAEEAVLVKDP